MRYVIRNADMHVRCVHVFNVMSHASAVQTIGGGSEMLVDVAPGVDWTAICGIMMVVQQARPSRAPIQHATLA